MRLGVIGWEDYEKAGYRKALGYIRVSTEGQSSEDKYGIDAQKSEITKYAMSRRYYIKEWFIDVCSGVTEIRPELTNILYYEKAPDVEIPVIAFKSDRIARDTKLYFYFLYEMERRNLKLKCVTEEFETEGEFANLYRSMLMFVAEQERKNIRLRTMNGKKIKQNQGGFIGGNAPYGYYSSVGKLEVQPYEAYIVKYIFHATYNQNKSMNKIAKELTENHIRPRRGSSWYASTVKSILSQKRFYQGYVTTMEGEEIKGQHKRLLKDTDSEDESLVRLDSRGNYPLIDPGNDVRDMENANVESVLQIKDIKNYDDIQAMRQGIAQRFIERHKNDNKEGELENEYTEEY